MAFDKLAWQRKYYALHGRRRSARSLEASTRWQQDNPEKKHAHDALKIAVKQGRVVRPRECSECGDNTQIVQGHHFDYNKPLEVIWLCPSCHKKKHLTIKP